MVDVSRNNNTLFPTALGTNLSHEFVVNSKPVVIRAFNLPVGVELKVEMGALFACNSNIWGPYAPCGKQFMIDTTHNSVRIAVSGLYRMFVSDPNDVGYEDLVVVQHEADVSEFDCCCEEITAETICGLMAGAAVIGTA